MKSKNLFLPFALLLFWNMSYSQQHNPYKSIGKEAKIVTLSNGKYDELVQKDSLEIIGSVIINRSSRKIDRFLDEPYSTYKEPKTTEQSKFLSVDPIANEYAELSPYQFASNRPIDGSDLDGLEYVQRNVTIDYATKKIVNVKDVWYNANQHNAHGKLGQGVMYKIMTHDASLRLDRKVEFQFVSRNGTDPFGLVNTEYGNYMGETGLFAVGDDGNFRNDKNDYSLPAVDAVDNLAKLHDKAYDDIGASGPNGLFKDWGATPADEAAAKGWVEFRDKYNVGDADPYNGQKVTAEQRSAAWNGKTLFNMVVADKKNAIAGFMLNNYRGESKTLSSNRNVQYNYELFLKKYMEKGENGNWQRKKNMWSKDNDGNWQPIAPKRK